MHKVLVSLYEWITPALYSSETELENGDSVVVEGEFGPDIGTVQEVVTEAKDLPNSAILRKATKRDMEAFRKNEKKKGEFWKICKDEIKRLNVAMKLIDARLTLDGGNIIIAFTADGRIDFRDLVRNLSKILHRSIRMQQIGSRDEARRLGGCGICGKELCCAKFSGNIPSISTDMARVQQIAHRGSDRISGACGRLMCCLAYEAEQYKELLAEMPELHSFVKTKEGKGEVIELNALKQELRVKLEDNQIITVKNIEVR